MEPVLDMKPFSKHESWADRMAQTVEQADFNRCL
jgi:hypothetical protein